MGPDGGELHRQRVAQAAADIRRDFIAAGWAMPSDTVLRRAADIVASYPDAWPHYDAAPDDWDGRIAVAMLWTWRKVRADPAASRAAAA
jgi:hypothetical protein